MTNRLVLPNVPYHQGAQRSWGWPVQTIAPLFPHYTTPPPVATIRALRGIGQSPTDLQSLGGAVMAAFAADSNGCGNVCINGTAVNSAVHAFKVAWNQTGWGVDPVPAGTSTLPGADAFATYGPLDHNGQYDQACANAIAATGLTGVLGPCSSPCNAAPGPQPQPTSAPVVPTAAPAGGGKNYLPWILGGAAVLGAGIVGYAFYSRSKQARGLRSNPLTYRQRKRLPASTFALPKRRALPLNDASHVRNAAARLSMMRHSGSVTPAEYRQARRRIIAAACRKGVEKTCRAHLT